MNKKPNFSTLIVTLLWQLLLVVAIMVGASSLISLGLHFVYNYPLSPQRSASLLVGSFSVIVFFAAAHSSEPFWNVTRKLTIYSLFLSSIFFCIAVLGMKLRQVSGFSTRDALAFFGSVVLAAACYFYLKSIHAFSKK